MKLLRKAMFRFIKLVLLVNRQMLIFLGKPLKNIATNILILKKEIF